MTTCEAISAEWRAGHGCVCVVRVRVVCIAWGRRRLTKYIFFQLFWREEKVDSAARHQQQISSRAVLKQWGEVLFLYLYLVKVVEFYEQRGITNESRLCSKGSARDEAIDVLKQLGSGGQ